MALKYEQRRPIPFPLLGIVAEIDAINRCDNGISTVALCSCCQGLFWIVTGI